MPSKLRPFLLALLLLLLASIAPAYAGEGPPDSPPFPLPVLAPVLDPEDITPALAVSSYGITDDGESIEVRFADSFPVPSSFQYRVELHVGDPNGGQTRVSLVDEEGDVSGLVEEGEVDDWNEIGTVDAAFREDGVVVMDVPAEIVDSLDTEGEPMAWVEVHLQRESSGGAEQFVTPLVPASALFPAADDVELQAATEAWGSDEQPPDAPVETGAPPTMRLEGDELIIEYSEPVPTEVDGAPVEKVTDVVRIAPDFAGGGEAPYLLVIDHSEHTVSLLDGSLALPAEVRNDGSWLLEGLPTRGVEEGDVIRASLEDVLGVFGIESDDLATDDHVALGIARSVRVTDEEDPGGDGIVYRPDGVLATAQWLAASDVVTPASTPTQVTAGDAGEESTRSKLFGPVVTISVVALLATFAYLLARWLDHRRRMRATGPTVEPRPAPAPTEEEREELEEFTREIFGGR
jgi:hypothetical protein